MGITGINLSQVIDYVSKRDTVEPKTIWKLGALDSEVFAAMGKLNDNLLQMTFEIVRFGLKGIENFRDSYGNPVKFTTVSTILGAKPHSVVADNIMKIIPPEILTELSGEILKLNRLTEEEIKN